jgi:hypothetical protein
LTPTTRTTAGGSADELPEFLGVANQLPVHALADDLQDLLGGLDADIGSEKRGFQLLQQIGVDFLAARERRFQVRHQPLPGLLDAALEAIQERGFGGYRAEQCLNHY